MIPHVDLSRGSKGTNRFSVNNIVKNAHVKSYLVFALALSEKEFEQVNEMIRSRRSPSDSTMQYICAEIADANISVQD